MTARERAIRHRRAHKNITGLPESFSDIYIYNFFSVFSFVLLILVFIIIIFFPPGIRASRRPRAHLPGTQVRNDEWVTCMHVMTRVPLCILSYNTFVVAVHRYYPDGTPAAGPA